MKPLTHLNPAHILSILDAIDAEAPSYSLDRRASLRRIMAVLACVCVCLLLVHYGKYSSNLRTLLTWFGAIQGQDFIAELRANGFLELAGYAWWSGVHLVGYVLLPALVIRFILKERVLDMGWRWGETHSHWLGYLLLVTPILFFVYLVSLGQDFVHHYPFYGQASRSWLDLIAWELLYIAQFVFLEFFFRGFMLNALRPALGANAIWVMCVPYLMIHFPKLWLEATGAILFGLFLGILALRSRSIWGGVAVHVTIALAMDFAALWRKSGLPDVWLP
ncbi:CPBP family intramembrane metalloprotease [Gilvimarinus sp. SDUM040013]|uniref:CPBP family intramembrane glutamic endopeptidase n=1 Tax=Gilvimarinus gilvus TaxID=3058038 RepID=A0ABU4RZM6_9GAMM|nr:CPBP family intramembrane glutamic endopeptidase [Gilvimarinus sp. SDUM040013]MDO3388716.1 CPBP family intramembrane metalloprotease [Gilvimarinus sp. SDUM040013]MDX6849611.1 CPBP family intramembrane glutamic endopeptidase [Gilvimarinus sp. SDUM040013]